MNICTLNSISKHITKMRMYNMHILRNKSTPSHSIPNICAQIYKHTKINKYTYTYSYIYIYTQIITPHSSIPSQSPPIQRHTPHRRLNPPTVSLSHFHLKYIHIYIYIHTYIYRYKSRLIDV
jgi:hypothetical protein